MKIKRVVIDEKVECCRYCHYFDDSGPGYFCDHPQNDEEIRLNDRNIIPDWCPLPDYKEGKKP